MRVTLGLAFFFIGMCLGHAELAGRKTAIFQHYPSSKESLKGRVSNLDSFEGKSLQIEANKSDEAYRLLCFPTWEPLLLITIKRNGDVITLETRQSGADAGYLITDSVFDMKRNLTAKEWKEFKGLFEKVKFWLTPKNTQRAVLDGTGYVLEVISDSQYRKVIRGDVEPREYPEDVPWANLFSWLIARVPQKGIVETSDCNSIVLRNGSGFYLDSSKPSSTSSKGNH